MDELDYIIVQQGKTSMVVNGRKGETFTMEIVVRQDALLHHI
jgi:hypothetical protein